LTLDIDDPIPVALAMSTAAHSASTLWLWSSHKGDSAADDFFR
jgi:hypothetical protein